MNAEEKKTVLAAIFLQFINSRSSSGHNNGTELAQQSRNADNCDAAEKRSDAVWLYVIKH